MFLKQFLFLFIFSFCYNYSFAQNPPPPPPPPPYIIQGSFNACEGDIESYTGIIGSNPPNISYFFRWSVWLGNTQITNLNTSQTGNVFNVAWDLANLPPNQNYQIRLSIVDGANNNLYPNYPYSFFNVTVRPKPNPNITSTNPNTCQVLRKGTTSIIPDGDNTCYKVCTGSNFTFITPFNAGSTYTWSAVNSNGQPVTQIGSPNIADVTFSFAGSASISVTETNGFGCSKTYEKCILVVAPPTAHFASLPAYDPNTNSIEVCSGTSISFTNQSVASANDDIISWHWSFGDGTFDNAPNVEHFFTNSTGANIIRNVVLTVTNGCGCTSTKTIQVIVRNTVVPDIQCVSTICPSTAPENYFINNLPAGCSNINWSVTGGTINGANNLPNVNVEWGNGNSGSGELTVQIDCPGICNLPYTVLVPIVATNAQIVGDATPCANENTIYQLPNVPGTTYNWSVSNGAVGLQGQNPNQFTVNFLNSGPYAITCNYYNRFLECGGSASFQVNVLGRLELFSQGKVCSGSVGTGTDQITTNDPSLTYSWQVTDIYGGNINFPGLTFPVNASHFPPSGISWPVVNQETQLIVSATNSNFCNTTESLVITLFPQPPPVTSIVDPGCFCVGTPVTYSASNSANQYYLAWEFPSGLPLQADGNSATVSWNPGASSYNVLCYQVMAQLPNCRSQAFSLPVFPCPAPNANNIISGPNSACVNSISSFAFAAGVTSAQIVISPSSIGSLVTGSATVPNFSIQWNNVSGTATISISYSFCEGQNISVTKQVIVNTPPSPVISGTSGFCQGAPSSNFTLAPATGTAVGTQISWFLDGSTTALTNGIINGGLGFNPSSVSAGNHTIRARWFDVNCNSMVWSNIFSFTVNAAPLVGLSNGLSNVCPYGTLFNGTLTGVVSNSATVGNCTFTWSGTSGIAGSTTSPNGFTSIFTANNATISGPVSIFLTATSTTGCSANSNVLNLSCVSGGCGGSVPMTITYTENCGQVAITNVNCASCNSTSFSYEYPLPPTTSSVNNNTATFNQAGSFPVKILGTQTIGGNNNCSAWSIQNVVIPLALNPVSTFVCGPTTENVYRRQLTANVTHIAGVTNIAYNWSLSGPAGTTTYTTANPLLPLAAGAYNATLTVNASYNGSTLTCGRTINFNMPQRPSPAFSIAPLTSSGYACPGTPLTFSMNTQNQQGIAFYTWDYDDLSSSNVPNISYHTYNVGAQPISGIPPNFLPSLTLIDQNGCTSIGFNAFTLGTNTQASTVALSPISTCINQPAFLTAQIDAQGYFPPYTYYWQNLAAPPTSNTAQVYETGTYGVTVTNGNGCISAPATANVALNPIPSIVLNGNTNYCHGEQTNISVFGGNSYTYTFNIYYNGVSLSGPPSDTYTNADGNLNITVSSSFAPYTVVAVVSNNYNCSNSRNFTINVTSAPPPPSVSFLGNACLVNGPVYMQVNNPNTSAYTYIWNNGNIATTNTGTTSGIYFCFAIDNATQCRSAASASLSVQTGPNFSTMITGCYTLECNETRVLSVQSGFAAYQWYSNNVPIVGAVQNTYTVATTGIYHVVVTDLNGCSYVSPNVDIEVIECPAVCCNNIIAYTSNLTCYAFENGQWTYTFDLVINNLNANPYPFTFECDQGTILFPNGILPIAQPGISIFQSLKYIDTGVPDPAFCMCMLFDQGDGTFCCLNSCSQLPDCDRLPPPNCEKLIAKLERQDCYKQNDIFFNFIQISLQNTHSLNAIATVSLATNNGNLQITGNPFTLLPGQFVPVDMIYSDILPFINEYICLNIDILYEDGTTCQEKLCFKLSHGCIPVCDLPFNLLEVVCLPQSTNGNPQYQITVKIGHPQGNSYWGTFSSPLEVIGNIQPSQLNPSGNTIFTFVFEDFSNTQGQLADFSFILGEISPFRIRCKFNFLVPLPNCGELNRTQNESEISVSPNPATENITISYQNLSGNDATIQINNAAGQKVITLNAVSGMALMNHKIEHLSPGMYSIVLMGKNKRLANNKFQVIKP